MSTNLKTLISKLNDATRKAFEASAGLCVGRTHYDIEIEHYLAKVLDATDNDVASILKHFEVNRSRLTAELERALDNFKTGNARSPAFSPYLVKMLTEAWSVASLDFNAGNIRTGFTLLALLDNAELSRLVKETSKEMAKVSPEVLRANFYDIVHASRESQVALATGGTQEAGEAPAGPGASGGKRRRADAPACRRHRPGRAARRADGVPAGLWCAADPYER